MPDQLVPTFHVHTPGGLIVPIPLEVLRNEIGAAEWDRAQNRIILGYVDAEADRIRAMLQHPAGSLQHYVAATDGTPDPDQPSETGFIERTLGPDEMGFGD